MPVTEAQKRATAKYEKENYDKVLVRFPKGTKERIQNTGAESVNGYIIQCVLNSLETSQKAPAEPISEQMEEVPQETAHREPTLEELQELQELIEQKKAEHDREAEVQKISECEKEQTRRESLAKNRQIFD